MPTYFKRGRNAQLTAGQRTSLVSLLSSIFPGFTAANISTVVFSRDPQSPSGVSCSVNERVQANALADIPHGADVEQE